MKIKTTALAAHTDLRTALHLLFAYFVCFAVSLSAFAQQASPQLIPFQGRLTDQQGRGYTNGQYTIVFNLYSQAVAGTPSWTERHQSVGVINGMINVFLGSIAPLSGQDFSTTKYLGITIDADNNQNTTDPEMVPRQMIIPAFWAKNSEKLAGYDWSAVLVGASNNPANGKILGSKIEPQGITAIQIQSNTITAGQIANGTITSTHLAGAIITSNQIVAGSISSQNLMDGAVSFLKIGSRPIGTNFVGIGGIVISASATNATTVSTTDTDITNLIVTIVTTGRPVTVQCMPSAWTGTTYPGAFYFNGGANSHVAEISLYRGNTKVISEMFGFNIGGNGSMNSFLPASAIQFTEFNPPVGTNVFSLKWRAVNGAGGDVYCNDVRIVAYEW